MNTDELTKYYNKFNEDKRLETRHGFIEFNTTIKYILKYLHKNDKIIEIGAGTGKYSGYLSNLGYDVTAVELVKHNLRLIEKNYPKVKSILGNALDLKIIPDKSFDMVLIFGPMYHLNSYEEKLTALKEAKRIVKDNGIILSVYMMNDYAILKHGFIDHFYLNEANLIQNDFKIISNEKDLYSYVRLNEIDSLNQDANLTRISILTQDGMTDYFRKEINSMDEVTFQKYFEFHLSLCEHKEILGLSAHILDIVKKS